ncbi:VTT domain-containing protein [Streptomyces sp. NPDC051572]|uniref:DedA family protein n=1 Tax=Streptomyces sp. NPDC051572 TaxID=3155802 RepID=UPI00344E765B
MTVIAANPMDSASLLAALGALGVLVVLFAESGLLVVGFFLPGDTLLFPAEVLCAGSGGQTSRLELWQVLGCAAVGAVAGAQVGFLLGRHGGRALLARTSNRRLKEGAAWAEKLLARYGYGRALVIGRFVPLLHPAAGVLGVPPRAFTVWQVVVGLLWSQASSCSDTPSVRPSPTSRTTCCHSSIGRRPLPTAPARGDTPHAARSAVGLAVSGPREVGRGRTVECGARGADRFSTPPRRIEHEGPSGRLPGRVARLGLAMALRGATHRRGRSRHTGRPRVAGPDTVTGPHPQH